MDGAETAGDGIVCKVLLVTSSANAGAADRREVMDSRKAAPASVQHHARQLNIVGQA